MSPKEPIILPDKYYLDYFHYLLNFVEKNYQHVLDIPEYLFYQSFRELSEDAQCLYIRFSNRKGDFFRLSKINYSEINNLELAKNELLQKDFIRINENDDLTQFHLFTKNELINLFDFLHHSQKKEELIQELTEADIPLLHQADEIAEVKKNEEVEFLKLLFFGHRGGKMTDFVIRDVGNVKIEDLKESNFKPWFSSREEAISMMHISQLKRMIYELQEAGLPLENYLDDLPWHSWLSYPRSAKSAEKLLLKIGHHFEQQKMLGKGLNYYALIDKPPARERRVRIMDKIGSKEEAIDLAKEMQKSPKNAAELTFASDFLKRKGVRINRSMTERLKSSPSIQIPPPETNVENAVLSYYDAKGWNGIHAENFIWRGLFGLVFWEIIFDTSHGSFHHPLQRQPSDLNDPVFFETRQPLLKKQLSTFKNNASLYDYVDKKHQVKHGIANRFVSWHESLLPSLKAMIYQLPLTGLKKVLLEMSKNMKENSAGFPDLFLWKENEYQFYEVKSPNDQLSAQQLFWLDFLQSVKIKTDVLRVEYVN